MKTGTTRSLADMQALQDEGFIALSVGATLAVTIIVSIVAWLIS